MSDAKKTALLQAKELALLALQVQTKAVGLPGGARVVTNASQVARFPLPLTIVSAVTGAIGVIAFMRGYKIVGGMLIAGGASGVAAAAAAPELIGMLNQGGSFVGRGPQ